MLTRARRYGVGQPQRPYANGLMGLRAHAHGRSRTAFVAKKGIALAIFIPKV
jgi:hypothetical protein